MLRDGIAEPLRHHIQRRIPVCPYPVDLRMQKPPVQIDGLPQGSAFGAEPPEVGRMIRIPLDCTIGGRQHTATYTAIRASGAREGHAALRACRNVRSSRMRPLSTRAG